MRMSAFRTIACMACLMLFMNQCHSQFRPPQVKITDQDTVNYAFLSADNNQLENSAYLEPLFQKMYRQRTEGGQKINIVHIGDSHILGNFLTREVRTRLQQQFGDAGRGFIFPYKLANSNGPKDYLTETNCKWNGSNCQRDLSEETPFGISGFSIEMTNEKGELTFRLNDTSTSETKLFSKITLFQRRSAQDFDLKIRDQVTNQTAQLYLEDDYSRSYYFDRPVAQATISTDRRTSQQKRLKLDGVSIENELSGVIYHSIGVNGAKFQDFVRAKYFSKQVAGLNPDLFILSFGTNESQGKTDPGYMYKTMEMLFQELSAQAPGALFLLTTPADSYLRGKGFNPHLADMSSVIRKFAKDHGLAIWDLYQISGGENSAQYWKSSGLMSSDSVHYSKSGYAAQGKLLYQAMIKGYNKAIDRKP
jgi:lysophospholipase L1-like esterase